MRYGKLEAVYQRVECRLWPAFSHPQKRSVLHSVGFGIVLRLGPRESSPGSFFMAEKLKVTYRRIEDLIPYARNARTHSDDQVARIAGSIKEFGWTNPILVDGENGIIAGHGRLAAARKLGMSEVPVIELDGLSDVQKRAYILADNRLALDAGWDSEMLSLELGDLKDAGGDLGLTGFTDEELDELLAPPTESVDGDEDEAPEPQEDPVSKRCDVWILGARRVMCGDACSADDISKLFGNRVGYSDCYRCT